MAWIKGRKRNPIDTMPLIIGLCESFGKRAVREACEVNDRTLRRWLKGEDNCPLQTVQRGIDKLFKLPGICSFDPGFELNANTRCVGVGQYTRESASGVHPFGERIN